MPPTSALVEYRSTSRPSASAQPGLLHERLIAPLLPHPGTAETLDIALTGRSARCRSRR